MNKIKSFAMLAATISAMVSGCGKENDKVDAKPAETAQKETGEANVDVLAVAQAKSAASVFTMSGRKLVAAIISANIDRMSKGLPSLWPHNDENDGKSTDADDVAGMSFNTSTDYFKEIFDVKNQQDAENWAPYLEGCELGWLAGGEIPVAKPGRLAPENVGWIVASGITEEMPDCIPALISANANTDMLITHGKASTASDKRQIPIGTANGAPKDIFANQFVVVITKGGSAAVYGKKHFTISDLYQRQDVAIPDGVTLRYLKP